MKAQIPNILSIGRIISIPLMMLGILTVGDQNAGIFGKAQVLAALFILASITDFLDGYLARKWEVTSDFGRMIDPIADKLLVAGCLIAIAIVMEGQWYILIPASAIIGRDVFVSGLREHAALNARVMPPTRLAKWKTATEMVAIAFLIAWVILDAWLPITDWLPGITDASLRIGLAGLWIAAILSVWTGWLYLKAALRD